MALNRVWLPSPNYSGRGGARVTTIVLHTAEGALSYQSLGNFFASPSAGVSSHAGIDDTPGTIGEYVRRDLKAWTAANANPWSVQAELCAFAAWDGGEWDRHPQMLRNTADWIAEEAAAYGIPIELLDPGAAQDPGVPGVCQHADLGSMGGGHWDCGPGFPIDRVLDMARGGIEPEPEPEPEPEGGDMANLTICAAHGDPQQWVTDLTTFKRPITSEDDWNSTTWCLVASGAKLYYNPNVNDPIRVPVETLAGLPEIR